MNLRDFKKDVEYVVGEFVDDCTLFLAINPHKATDEVAAVIEEAVDLYNDLLDKANSKVEGAISVYFNSIRKELLEKTNALYEKLSEMVKAAKPAV